MPAKSAKSVLARVIPFGAALLALSAGFLWAHDFWIVPTGFLIDLDGTLEIRGQTSTRFPTTVSAVVPERVAEARLISATSEERITAVVGGPPDVDITDDDDTCHRMWALPASGDGPASVVAGALLEAAGAHPVTIADGHHRYETALRYRDERRMTRSCEEDPPFDYLLTLFLDATSQPLTVLPTHRIVRSLAGGLAGTIWATTT